MTDDRADLIERKIDLDRASSIKVSTVFGSLMPDDMSQVFDFAKGMSLSGPLVPAFCRNRPWACFGIASKAIGWGLDPYTVASMAYEVEDKRTGETTVAFMSQLWHSVLEKRKVLKERLRVTFEGEGDEMVCIVSGHFKGEETPLVWRSEPLRDLRPKVKRGRDKNGNEYEYSSGSPLWIRKPKMQMHYDTSRDWIRVYAPDIIQGVYSVDEMDAAGFTPALPPPGDAPDDGGLGARLSEASLKRLGFSFSPEATAAAIDGKEAMAETAAGPSAVPLSSDAAPGGDDSGGSSSPPAPAADGQGQAAETSAATSGPENDEGQPRASQRARRTPRPVGQHVGNPDQTDDRLV